MPRIGDLPDHNEPNGFLSYSCGEILSGSAFIRARILLFGDLKIMESSKTSQPAFRTSDLTLASFLRCRGFDIAGLTREDGKTSFVFEDSTELRGAVLEYANNGPVAVRTFCGTMRDLKAITR